MGTRFQNWNPLASRNTSGMNRGTYKGTYNSIIHAKYAGGIVIRAHRLYSLLDLVNIRSLWLT